MLRGEAGEGKGELFFVGRQSGEESCTRSGVSQLCSKKLVFERDVGPNDDDGLLAFQGCFLFG